MATRRSVLRNQKIRTMEKVWTSVACSRTTTRSTLARTPCQDLATVRLSLATTGAPTLTTIQARAKAQNIMAAMTLTPHLITISLEATAAATTTKAMVALMMATVAMMMATVAARRAETHMATIAMADTRTTRTATGAEQMTRAPMTPSMNKVSIN